MDLKYLLEHFFTHKDFLPSADQLAGTLFTPLQMVFSVFCLALVLILAFRWGKKDEAYLRRCYGVLWAIAVVLEPTKIIWETVSGASVNFEWGGVIPLYPCSIFLYAMPFAIWGKGNVRRAACGYVCTLGLLGGLINFVYPVNILSNYSCISFAGFHTLYFHGAIVLCALSMLLSGYHSYTGVTKWQQLLLPSVPFLITSLVANAFNFSKFHTDYMFFRLDSFIFQPLGEATPDWLGVILVYLAYLLIHGLPYLPSYLSNRKKLKSAV